MKCSAWQFRVLSILTVGFLGVGCSKARLSNPPSPSGEEAWESSLRHQEYLRDAAQLSARAVRAQTYRVKQYDIQGRFDWSAKALRATVGIELELVDKTARSIALDSRVAQVLRVTTAQGRDLPFQVDQGKGLLNVDLASLPADQLANAWSLSISYVADASVIPGKPTGSALVAVLARAGDPVGSRVVYTSSEPRDARTWFPCLDDPSNRARVTLALSMPPQEMLVANGDLVENRVDQGVRYVKYSTQYPIPTYLTAFAQGEFTTTTRYHGRLPVSLWARRGLPVDWDGMLNELVRQIRHYESLLVPYPFEKYALVLLPEFGGGMENVGITFQEELSSTQSKSASDLSLTAHELGHQWFGDLVTVRTWDDLWIKEGMATLLASEASRNSQDYNQSGRLFGSTFGVGPGFSIVDSALAPEQKYTSGPYGRAAWLLTQMRAAAGDDKFWAALREVLRKHAFGSVSTAEFLDAFRPALGDALIASIGRALAAKTLPQIDVQPSANGLTLSLQDSEGALIAPVSLRQFGPSGGYQTATLIAGAPLEINVASGRLVELDTGDLHPLRTFFKADAFERVAPLLVPQTAEGWEAFARVGGHSQALALSHPKGWSFDSSRFASLYSRLAADHSKFLFLQKACEQLSSSADLSVWKRVLEPSLLSPPYLNLDHLGVGLSHCRSIVTEALITWRLRQLSAAPVDPQFNEAELRHWSTFAIDAEAALETWGRLGLSAPSFRSRLLALNQLVKHARATGNFPSPAVVALDGWKQYFRDLLLLSEDWSRPHEIALRQLGLWKDRDALGMVGRLVLKSGSNQLRRLAACTGWKITQSEPAVWSQFVTSLGNSALLPNEVQEVLADTKKCEPYFL